MIKAIVAKVATNSTTFRFINSIISHSLSICQIYFLNIYFQKCTKSLHNVFLSCYNMYIGLIKSEITK